MKRLFVLASLSLALSGLSAQAQTTIPAGSGRLDFFADKVRRKEPVVVTAIGGSITMGSGSSSVPKAYIWQTVSKLGSAIKERGSTMKFQWAPAGGTDSTYGAYRIGSQLLNLNPDLLIVEFAVNDGGNPNLDGMEGIVRQAWKQNPKMGIVFFETTSNKYETENYAKNALPASVEFHTKLGTHYNIPLVNTGQPVHAGIQDGTFTSATFWKDGTHPSDLGHTFYADILAPALIGTLDQPAPTTTPKTPAPLGTGLLENARFQPIVPAEPVTGWAPNDKDWFQSHKFTATEAKPISFPLSGNNLSLIFRGAMTLRWKDAAGVHQTATAQRGPAPSPIQFGFPGGSLPAGTIVTAEPIADPAGKVNAEIYGYYSVAK